MTERHRHVPLRRCVTCRSSLPKAQLVRLVHGESGWRFDLRGRAGGRGTWLCHDCVTRIDERATARALVRSFRNDADEVRALLRSLPPGVLPHVDAAATTPTPNDSRHGGTHG